MKTIPEPQKIAVLRANALGDYIFVLPALQALRERFPHAEIVLLGRQWHKDFLNNRPGAVDRVIVVPRYQGITEAEGFVPDENELNLFFSEMQKENFDIAFQLHGGGRNSNPFLARLGARLTVGLKTPDAAALDISVPYVYYFSEILRYLEVVALVGAKTSAIEPALTVTDHDIYEANKALPGNTNMLAIIHPGASDLRRHWPAENFASVADWLIENGYTVCITGTAFEMEVVHRVIEASQHTSDLINLCNNLSLSGMTGLLSMADILVSNDTGPLHLARALKTPTIGIYWCGNSITGLPMTTSVHRPLLSFKNECPVCGLSAKKFSTTDDPGLCKHEASFVSEITVEESLSTLRELLSYTSSQKSNQSEAA